MKKVLSLFVALLTIFVLFGCNPENKTLDTPSNIKISDTGLITWDAVSNATSYVVTINSESYITKTNSYQVKDITRDFNFTVKAMADGYESSSESSKIDFTGTSTASRNEMYQYCIDNLLGSKEDAEDEKTYETNVELFKIACDKAYDNGVTLDVLESFVDIIMNTEKPDIQTIVLSLLMNSTTLSKDQVLGMSYFLNYTLQALINNMVFSFKDTGLDVSLKEISNLLVRNNLEIATAFASIANQALDTYRQLSIQVIPQISELFKDGTFDKNPEKIVQIKDAAVQILLANTLKESDMVVLIDFVRDALTALKPYLADLTIADNIKLGDILTELEGALKDVQSSDIAKGITMTYVYLVSNLNVITKELLEKAFTYETPEQIIACIVLYALKDNLPTVELEDANLKAIIDSIYNNLKDQFKLPASSLQELLGMTTEDYNSLVSAVVKLINDEANVLNRFLGDSENIDAILKAMNFTVETISERSNKSLIGDEINTDEYLKRLFEEYGYESIDDLTVGVAYTLTNVTLENGVITYVELSIIPQKITTKDIIDSTGTTTVAVSIISYDYIIETVVVKNAEDLLPLVEKLVQVIKNEANLTITDVLAIVRLLPKVGLITDETANSIITMLANAKEEDVKLVVNDLINVVEKVLTFVKEKGLNEVIKLVLNNQLDELIKLFDEDTCALLDKLVEDLGTLIDNAKGFPMNYVFGDKEIKYNNKEEFVSELKATVDMLRQLAKGNTEESTEVLFNNFNQELLIQAL